MIREAVEEDFAPLTQLWHEGWHAGHAGRVPEALTDLRTPDSFLARLRAYGPDLLVTGAKGDPTSFVVLKPDEINQFYLRNDQRGTGLALSLMQKAEAELVARGTRDAFLDVVEQNDRAIGFYLKAGWQKRGVETITVDTSQGPFEMRALVMTKRLSP